MRMKSCQYCGLIVLYNHACDKKPQPKKKFSNQNKFRWTKDWQHKREDIKKRDGYVCRVCLSNKKITTEGLSVHHIVPMEEDYSLRLEDSNLLTVCDFHHERCEDGTISRKEQKKLVPPTLSP